MSELSEYLSVETDGRLIYADYKYDSGPAVCFPVRGVDESSMVSVYFFTLDVSDRYRR